MKSHLVKAVFKAIFISAAVFLTSFAVLILHGSGTVEVPSRLLNFTAGVLIFSGISSGILLFVFKSMFD